MGHRKRRPLCERLLARLVRRESGCWEWSGCRDRKGYGQIGRGGKTEGHAYTHRIAWEIWRGPIPEGLWVLHRCDNPPCCNPEHLFLGTAEDNNRDMNEKGRHRSTAILTRRQLVEIICNRGLFTQTRLARIYGVSDATVSYAVNKRAA